MEELNQSEKLTEEQERELKKQLEEPARFCYKEFGQISSVVSEIKVLSAGLSSIKKTLRKTNVGSLIVSALVYGAAIAVIVKLVLVFVLR